MRPSRVEAFLAKLYTDEDFLGKFLREPEILSRKEGLTGTEAKEMAGMDLTGLGFAADSFKHKRRGRGGKGRKRFGIL